MKNHRCFENKKSLLETFGARTFHEVTSKPLRGKEVGIIEIPTCYPEKKLHSTWIYKQ